MYLKFDYKNWEGRWHTYIISPTGAGIGSAAYDRNRPVLHGDVISRDGDPRPNMGLRRRTFKIVDMKNLQEVERNAR